MSQFPAAYTRFPRHLALRARLGFEQLEDRVVPDGRPLPLPVIFIASGEGQAGVVRAYDAETGALNFERPVFDPAFTGGVRVAAADFSGDGFPDVVVAAGPGGGPNVKVLDGKTGDPIPGPLGSFFAYDPAFAGGVEVTAADVDGDSFPDLITGAGVGGAAHVQVFGGRDGSLLASYLSFDLAFRGGVSVAAADFTGDGKAEVVTGAGPGGGPHVKVLDALTGEVVPGPLGSFFAFDGDAPGGVAVAADWKAGDVDADGVPDLAVGTGPGAATRVRVFSGATGAVLRDLAPFDPAFAGGVSLGLAYVSDDPYADIVVGTGPGTPAAVRVFSGTTGELLAPPQGEYAPFGAGFTGGVRVAATNDPVYLTVTRVAHAVEPTTNGGTFTPGVFRISVAGTRTTSFTASFSLTGTAVGGTDYTTPPTTITVTPSQNTYDVTIAPRYDTLSEGAEQLRLSLSGGSGYEVTAPGSADMWVLDPGASPPPPTGAIGDYAWYDVNGNGAMDGAETHAAGVTVALSGGPTAKSPTTTNTYGQYGFTGLDDGTYTVTFSKSGYSFSTPAGGKATVVVSGGVGGSANAGLVQNGSVGDFVWEDLNRDGDQDAGEPGISGAVVDLYPLPSGAPLQRTTGADGKYSFAGIPPGLYVARVQLPAGFQFTAPWVSTGGVAPADGLTPSGADSEVDPIYAWTGSFTVAQGQAELGLDAGAYRPPAGTGTAYGTVWDDANGDGLQAGETGLGGVRVDIYDAAGVTYLGWATTGPRGGYTFPGLGAGTYTLRVRAPYALSPKDVGANDAIDSDFDPASGAVAFTVASGQAVFRDAGVKRPPAAPVVGDRAWVDADRDGVQDPDEPGLPGVIVRLRDGALNQLAEVTTDAGGWYSFSGAGRTGLHQLVFIAPSGYRLTHAGAGSDPAKDSDPDPVTSSTDWFTFSAGTAQLDFDAGMVATAGTGAIVGTVWDDLYATYGLRTTGGGNYEPGLPGVTVELLNPPGNPVLDAAGQPVTAKTGSGGGYVFPGLSTTNSYKVRVQPPRPLADMDYGGNAYDTTDSDFDPLSNTSGVVTPAAGVPLVLDAAVQGEVTVGVVARVANTQEVGDLAIPVNAEFEFTRTGGDVTKPFVVRYKLDGSTATPADYLPAQRLYGEVTIPGNPDPTAKSASVKVPITPVQDGLAEPDETLVVTLLPDPLYKLGTDKTATATISNYGRAEIGNLVWHDLNRDGLQDYGEPGIDNVQVKLYAAGNPNPVGTKTTQGGGYYRFDDLAPGQYSVQFGKPTDYAFTGQVPLNAQRNSDASPADGKTSAFTVAAGETNDRIDAGLVTLGTNGVLVGPAVVPGNSAYYYSVRLPGNATNYSFREVMLAPAGADVGSTVSRMTVLSPVYDPASNTTLFSTGYRFYNTQPAKVRLEAYDTTTGQTVASKEVVVVQILVAPSPTPVAGPNPPAPAQSVGRVEYPAGSAGGQVFIQTTGAGVNGSAGAVFAADVELKGPGNNEGVDKIKVGVSQTLLGTVRAQYAGPSGWDRWIVEAVDGVLLRDEAAGGANPWYFNVSGAGGSVHTPAGPADNKPRLFMTDTPKAYFDLTWQSADPGTVRSLYPNVDFLKKAYYDLAFTTYVAAQATDPTAGANTFVWGEARIGWEVKGSRDLTQVVPVRDGNTITSFNLTWANPDPSRVQLTSPTWTPLSGLTPMDRWLPVANQYATLPDYRTTTPP